MPDYPEHLGSCRCGKCPSDTDSSSTAGGITSARCPRCKGDGWLYYSTGGPIDVCESCHGTGAESAYAAYNERENLTAEVATLRAEVEHYRSNMERVQRHLQYAMTERSEAMPDTTYDPMTVTLTHAEVGALLNVTRVATELASVCASDYTISEPLFDAITKLQAAKNGE